MRFDFEILAKYFKYDKKITTIKFSPNGVYLLAGTNEPSILLFVYANGTYFYDPLKIILN